MIPFLKELAQELLHRYPNRLDTLTLIFPNVRAGLFFRKYLAELIDTPVWSPQIMGLEDFFRRQSSLQLLDRLSLVFRLYGVYRQHHPREEGFDRFFYWGELLLSDFDAIDKHLVDAATLFTNLASQKELDSTFDYLSEEQKELILGFWRSFDGKGSLQQRHFQELWETLYAIYSAFREGLRADGLAYPGMLYADVAASLGTGAVGSRGDERLVFAGFNALTTAEERVISWYVEHHKALVFWDIDAYYMEDEAQEAGFFFRKYRDSPVFSDSFSRPYQDHLSRGPKSIDIIGVPLSVGQAKLLGQRWQVPTGGEDVLTDREKEVIVLPEESMLFPVLHALPPEVGDINVTMGFPLQSTPIYQFFEQLLTLQMNVRKKGGAPTFYHRDVLVLLRHPYLQDYDRELASKNIRTVESENRIYIGLVDLALDDALYPLIFQPIAGGSAIFDYLIDILLYVTSEGEGDTGMEEVRGRERPVDAFEQECAYYFYVQMNRLREIIGDQDAPLGLEAFLRLFREVTSSLRLPFSGEPLEGLQVMGLLETRNLDFERVSILCMNEDIFPASGRLHSFIPYNLRKAYGLPTYDGQEAMYAYLFYRILQRAGKVTLYYNTESGLNAGGEMSRFLLQLVYSGDFHVRRYVLTHEVRLREVRAITLPKGEAVRQGLERFLVRGAPSQKRLTPSAINIYLSCRLRFYFRYVVGIYESDMVREEIDPVAFGKLLHRAMELLYACLMEGDGSGHVARGDFARLRDRVEAVVARSFREYYGIPMERPFQPEGRNVIVSAVIRKFVLKVLDVDEAYAPFEILGLEVGEKEGEGLDMDFGIWDGVQKVGLKGIIDRIDRKGGVVRIIDYKTGKDKKSVPSVASLFDREDPLRNKAAFQTLYYAYLYWFNATVEPGVKVVPGVFNSKEMFGEKFDPRFKLASGSLDDAVPLMGEFEAGLRVLLEEIFDPGVPFDQTQEEKNCLMCPYRGICHR